MIDLNLLPPSAKNELLERNMIARILRVCLIVVLIFLLIFAILVLINRFYFTPQLNRSVSALENNRAENSTYTIVSNKALLINDLLGFVQAQKNKNNFYPAIISDINASVPDKVQIITLSFNPTENPSGKVTGKALSEADAVNFKKKIEDKKRFTDVIFKDTSAKENSFYFTLEFNLNRNVEVQL